MTDEHVAEEQVTDRIWTIPNIVSFVRLAGVPVFWWVLLVQENVALAAVFIFLIGWTDWIDGYLARSLNQVSKLGKTLDPVADRLMIASAVIGGLIVGVVPGWIGIPLIAREVFMAGVTGFLWYKGAPTLAVRYWGKVATFLIYGSIPAFYLAAAGFLETFMLIAAWVSGIVGLVMYWIVAFQYVGDARSVLAELESAPAQEETE